MLCRLDPPEHGRQAIASGDSGEMLAVDRVQRHVDPRQSGLHKLRRLAIEADPIGRHRHGHARHDCGRPAHDLDQIRSRKRLAAGETHLAYSEIVDGYCDQARDLFRSQQLPARDYGQAFRRHAVCATQ